LHLLLSRDAAKSLALSSSSLVVLVRIVVAEFVVPLTPRRRDCDGNNFLFSTTTGAPTPRPAPECFARARTKRGSARRPHLIIIIIRVKAASLAKVVARVTYYYVREFSSLFFSALKFRVLNYGKEKKRHIKKQNFVRTRHDTQTTLCAHTRPGRGERGGVKTKKKNERDHRHQ
tara:strand:- start:3 stop:524 length:522 start_codon:yes stop_codon:yes gene_type:complete